MQLIAKVSEVPNHSTKEFEYQGKPAILINWDNQFHAFVNECTHEGGPNSLQGDLLVCAWHFATFDPKTGEALSPPAPPGSKLPRIELKIEGDEIYAL